MQLRRKKVKLKEIGKALDQLKEMNQDDDVSRILDTVEGEFSEKALKVNHVLTDFDNNIDQIDREIKRLQARKKIESNKKNSLKEYLRYNMEQTGINKIESPLNTITLGKPSKVLIITNEDAIDDDYKEIKVITSIDKKRLLSALKNGIEIDGCHLGDSKSKLIIK